MLQKSSLSLALALVTALVDDCGGYGKQTSAVVPTSLAVTPMAISQSIGDDHRRSWWAREFRRNAAKSVNPTVASLPCLDIDRAVTTH